MNKILAEKIQEKIFKEIALSSEQTEEHIRALTDHFEYNNVDDALSKFSSVNGVGVNQDDDGKYIITIFTNIEAELDIKKLAAYFKIDPSNIIVRNIGEMDAHKAYTDKYRPIFPGASVGHPSANAGTVGCVVKNADGVFILGCNHVLTNFLNPQLGDYILQPGRYDNGHAPSDIIAKVFKYEALSLSNSNEMDAAIAKIDPMIDINILFPYIGKVSQSLTPALNMSVMKVGRTTEFTRGIIRYSAPMKVNINGKSLKFINQFIVEGFNQHNMPAPFSEPGDSGSLVIEAGTKKAVGMVIAGKGNLSLITPIEPILNKFKVNLAE